jgi:hypothetical protein
MTDQTMQQNAYKNMLLAVSNAVFIRLVPTSPWLRIDYVEPPDHYDRLSSLFDL